MLRAGNILVTIALTSFLGCSGPSGETVRIFAAVSTTEALEKARALFEARTGTHIEISPGATSDLARQIEQGADADLFLSADETWADHITAAGLTAERRDLLTNSLVIVVPADDPLLRSFAELAEPRFKKIALAGPAVPAGRYGRQALKAAEILDQVKERILNGKDVRAALTYVERQEADAAIVYSSDTVDHDPAGSSGRSAERIQIAWRIDPKLHEPIRYPLLLIRHESIKSKAEEFYRFLGSPEAIDIFAEAGFGSAS
jgi:molybdate transport system substrate-binding protein